jgi:hypothetical protein
MFLVRYDQAWYKVLVQYHDLGTVRPGKVQGVGIVPCSCIAPCPGMEQRTGMYNIHTVNVFDRHCINRICYAFA